VQLSDCSMIENTITLNRNATVREGLPRQPTMNATTKN
jgi:hypothetical protein